MARYPHIPGSVADSATSDAAADAAAKFAPSMADRCEAWFKRHTERGELKTCEECELAAREAGAIGRHQTISARIRTDLFINRQCLYKVGTDRYTGQHVKVWYVTDLTNLVVNAKGKIVYLTRVNTTGRQAWLYGWEYRDTVVVPLHQLSFRLG
jgi:hypothetical protein